MTIACDASVGTLIVATLHVLDKQRAIINALSHICWQSNVISIPCDRINWIAGHWTPNCQWFTSNGRYCFHRTNIWRTCTPTKVKNRTKKNWNEFYTKCGYALRWWFHRSNHIYKYVAPRCGGKNRMQYAMLRHCYCVNVDCAIRTWNLSQRHKQNQQKVSCVCGWCVAMRRFVSAAAYVKYAILCVIFRLNIFSCAT